VIVVDTNILLYRFLPHAKNRAAEALAELDAIWAAPLLWRSEFRNVVAGYMRAGRFGLAQAEQLVERASSRLLGGEHPVADQVVLGLVARSRCSAYDCEFAGLAGSLETILITEDRALLSAFPKLFRSLDEAVQKGKPRWARPPTAC
jgi:predicted nucleic acid-binding protein